MKFKKILEIKKLYELLTWKLVKAEKPVPSHYNIILDLIEIVERDSRISRDYKVKTGMDALRRLRP